ncbi:K+ channel tetramerisation domain protein [Ancylostoma ceylanicum]|nr:K+ channel tetramerisation domain protein [Ancylostoma ceylanicum]EYC09462.1 hypothetical protein Y032_0060g3131 [Ancylostoma ceylanicum]
MSGTVILNVGGQKFTTTVETLTSTNSKDINYFAKLDTSHGEIFIDRDPTVFQYFLNYLRDGVMVWPEDHLTRTQILEEAKFYGFNKLIERTGYLPTLFLSL